MESTATMVEELIIEEVTAEDIAPANGEVEKVPVKGKMEETPEKMPEKGPENTPEEKTRRLAIICSKGSLDMAYPGLILANAARMMGIDADLFFTFWGMDIIAKNKVDHLQVTPVGNTAMHMPQMLGVLPGISGMATSMMTKELEKLDMPPVHEFLTMIHDAGAGIYACRMASEMMHLEKENLVEEVDDIIGAMEFLEKAEGAQLLFI
jgi:peroxiredoxin family protein